jgi:hypothetical protein
MWQNYWEYLVVYPSKTYSIPTGAIGKWFIRELVQQLDNVANRAKLQLREVHSISNGHSPAGQQCQLLPRHQENY